MLLSHRIVVPLLLLAAACGRGRNETGGGDSQLATFTVGEYKPAATLPQWSDLKVNLNEEAPGTGKVEKKFTKTSFTGGKAEDVAMTVAYGTYKILLTYNDAAGKTLYKSCAADQDVKHEIKTPTYEAKITICDEKSQPTGTVVIEKTSSVIITPTAGGTVNPTPTPTPTPSPTPKPGTPTALSGKLLIGYWHNWTTPAKGIKLKDVSNDWDIIQIAFAEPELGAPVGRLTFKPDPGIESVEEFKADVAALHAKGKKVLISIGGEKVQFKLNTAESTKEFTDSMTNLIKTYGFDGLDLDLEGASLSLDAGDTDIKNPKTPGIVNMIAAVKEIKNRIGAGFVLTMAPETAYVQGGFSAYAGAFGAYLPVIHGLRDILTILHVQHYNTGSMLGLDGKAYSSGNAAFHVAMTEMMIAGFPVQAQKFEGLRPDQVAIGVPSQTSAAGSGFTSNDELFQALNYLTKGEAFKDYKGTYKLQNAAGYPQLRGLMSWSLNWDAVTADPFVFSKTNRKTLDALPK